MFTGLKSFGYISSSYGRLYSSLIKEHGKVSFQSESNLIHIKGKLLPFKNVTTHISQITNLKMEFLRMQTVLIRL